MMNLRPRPVELDRDTALLSEFLTGRQPWTPLPPYWNTGKTRMNLYLTMYEGMNSNHLLWEDEAGVVQGYTYLSPDEETPIYSTPELREWRVLVHPDLRSKELVGRLITDAETRLNTRASNHPLTTVAYDSDQDLIDSLGEHGYVRQRELEVYMLRDLSAPIAAPVVPDGFVVRPFAGVHEIRTRASVTNSAFGGFEGPNDWALSDVGYMILFCAAIKAIDFVVATTAGVVASSAIAFYDPVTKLGEFDAVGTHRSYQRRGLAKALLLTGLHWLKGAGMETAVIRTDVDNAAALRAYESIGFETVDKLWLYEKQDSFH
jgi:ribosomal protein S18 acetylase RimI-like enzyme